MGDILKNNPILSHILIPLLLIFILFFSIGKPYIDRGDEYNHNLIMDEMIPRLDTIVVNQEYSNNLLRLNLK